MKIFNVLMFAFMIAMNYLANALPLNGKTTGELSDAYPNLFVPAGITFSIWGLIYLLLAIYCIVQFMQTNKKTASNIALLFALSSMLNGFWILAWHYQKLFLSVIIMIVLLIALIEINRRIKTQKPALIKAAFGIYLGWICIATIANVTALLVDLQWNGFGLSDQFWTIALIITGFLITARTVFSVNNPYIAIVVSWAFLGIAIKQQNDYQSIFISSIVALSIMFVIFVVKLYSSIKKFH